jgi:hypothetical protein
MRTITSQMYIEILILIQFSENSNTRRIDFLLIRFPFRYFVLKPGRLIFFKDPHEVVKAHCSGIINLQGCEVSIRTSKKVGSCFKIFHLLQYNIYSKQGLKGETLKSTFMPYNLDYCILRVNNDADRMKWMKAIQSAIPDYEKNKSLYTPVRTILIYILAASFLPSVRLLTKKQKK